MSIIFIQVNAFGLTAGISRPLTETVMSGHISALSETVRSECFAAQNANLTMGRIFRPICTKGEDALAKRCNDFLLLEEMCGRYNMENI